MVWDLPTRFFHWLFAGSFAVAFLTSEVESLFALHVFAGLLMLVLIAFRLIWGLVGSRYARFSSFPLNPVAAAKYSLEVAKGSARRYVGHNPAGSLAIYAMILLGLVTAASGLATLLGGESFEDVHEAIAWGMLTVVGIHLFGVLVESLVHRENLAKSMVDGRKEGTPEDGIRSGRPFAGVALLTLVVLCAGVFIRGYDPAQNTLDLPFVGKQIALSDEGEGHEHHGGHED
jgi:cytochrome b